MLITSDIVPFANKSDNMFLARHCSSCSSKANLIDKFLTKLQTFGKLLMVEY